MASPIILIKRGSQAPVVGQLRVGELALDKVKGILYVGSGEANADGFASKIAEYSNAAEIAQQIADLNARVTANAGDIVTAKTDIASNKAGVEANTASIGEVAGRVTAVEGEVETAQSDIAGLKTSVATNAEGVASAKGRLDVLEPKVSTLETDSATAKSDISGLKTDVAANTASVSALSTRVTDLDAANVKLDAVQTVTGKKTFEAIDVADQAKGDASPAAANTKFVTGAVADGVTAADASAVAKIAAIGLDNLASLETSKPITAGAPTEDNHLATKGYVDGYAQGLNSKDSVRASTTANIALTGAQTVDGVAVVAGDRVLVKSQTDAKENGIYVAADGAWTRSLDANDWSKIVSAYVFIEEGTVNKDSGWVCTVDRHASHVIGQTDITFTQFSKTSDIEAGAGLSKSGNVISIADSYTAATDAKIALKADKSYVDEELAKKAVLADVNTALAAKADSSTVEALTATVGTKASQTEVDALTATVGTKASQADLTALTTTVSGKADAETVNAALALKADTETVNSGLALKADKATVETELGKKANAAEVTSALALKADKTYVDEQLAVIDGGTF